MAAAAASTNKSERKIQSPDAKKDRKQKDDAESKSKEDKQPPPPQPPPRAQPAHHALHALSALPALPALPSLPQLQQRMKPIALPTAQWVRRTAEAFRPMMKGRKKPKGFSEPGSKCVTEVKLPNSHSLRTRKSGDDSKNMKTGRELSYPKQAKINNLKSSREAARMGKARNLKSKRDGSSSKNAQKARSRKKKPRGAPFQDDEEDELLMGPAPIDMMTTGGDQGQYRGPVDPRVMFAQVVLEQGALYVMRKFKRVQRYKGGDSTFNAFMENPSRNRYADIKCLDSTRVILKDRSNDYIHANWVKGFDGKRFICAQDVHSTAVPRPLRLCLAPDRYSAARLPSR